jgi:hypothetical protein
MSTADNPSAEQSLASSNLDAFDSINNQTYSEDNNNQSTIGEVENSSKIMYQPQYKEPPSGSSNKIRVIVRVRPFLDEELKEEGGGGGQILNCLRVREHNNEIE